MKPNRDQLIRQILQRKEQIDISFMLRSFRDQIVFMVESVEEKSINPSRSSCCWSRNEHVNQVTAKYMEDNRLFSEAFMSLEPHDKLVLLNSVFKYIQTLGKLYRDEAEKLQTHLSPLPKLFKNLTTNLIETHLSVDTQEFLKFTDQTEEMEMKYCDSDNIIKWNDWKNCLGILSGYKLQIITEDTPSFKLDLRNYLVKINNAKISFKPLFNSPTVKKIRFLLNKVVERQYLLIRELSMVGIIERVIRSLEASRLFADKDVEITQEEIVRKEFAKMIIGQVESKELGPMEVTHFRSPVRQASTIHVEVKAEQKQQQAQAKRRQEIRNKLIHTLIDLAELKRKENEKIQHFKAQQAIKHPKIKTRRQGVLLERFSSTIPSKFSQDRAIRATAQTEEAITTETRQLSVTAGNMLPSEQKQGFRISIVRRESLPPQSGAFYALKESFNDSLKQIQNQSSKQIASNTILRYCRFVFHEIQPNYNLSSLSQPPYLYDLIKLNPINYVFSIIARKEILIKMYEELNLRCKVYQKRTDNKNFRIVYSINADISTALRVFLNVESYPLWQRNIKKTKIYNIVADSNTMFYQMQCEIGKQVELLCLERHFFKCQNHSYIFQRSHTSQSTGMLSKIADWALFRPKKRTLQFALWKFEQSNHSNTCQATLEISFSLTKEPPEAAITFLVNYLPQRPIGSFVKDSVLDMNWNVEMPPKIKSPKIKQEPLERLSSLDNRLK